MKKKQDNKSVWITGGIILAIILLIFIPEIIKGKKKLDTVKREYNLIQEGKVKNDNEVINEIIDILRNRDKDKLEQYLKDDFVYINNDNYESKYISGFWNDLKYFTGKYYLEKRENSIKDEETYWIYWDIPEELAYEQYSQYSLQRIFVYLKRTVKENVITYEINKIILRDN